MAIISSHPFMHVHTQCEFELTSIKRLSLFLNPWNLTESKAKENKYTYNHVPCFSEWALANRMWGKAWNVLAHLGSHSLASLWSPLIAVRGVGRKRTHILKEETTGSRDQPTQMQSCHGQPFCKLLNPTQKVIFGHVALDELNQTRRTTQSTQATVRINKDVSF